MDGRVYFVQIYMLGGAKKKQNTKHTAHSSV